MGRAHGRLTLEMNWMSLTYWLIGMLSLGMMPFWPLGNNNSRMNRMRLQRCSRTCTCTCNILCHIQCMHHKSLQSNWQQCTYVWVVMLLSPLILTMKTLSEMCGQDSNLYESKLVTSHTCISAKYNVGFRHPGTCSTVVPYQTSLLRASKATLCTFSSPLWGVTY